MNLEIVRKVLDVSEAQPFDFVKLRGQKISWEIREMEKAGLVELSAAQIDDPDLAVIKRVTNAGRRLLRILRDKKTALCLNHARTSYGAQSRLPRPELEMVLL